MAEAGPRRAEHSPLGNHYGLEPDSSQGRWVKIVGVVLLAAFISLPAVTADSTTPSNATNAALLEQGKKIFVTRCAKCHDNNANKKLPDGTTLLGRLAKIQDPEVRLGTRLKDPQERHAVMIYVDSLLKNLQSSSQ